MTFKHYLKQRVERAFGLRIYRSATPLGLDLINDLKRIAPQFQPRIIFDVGANVGQTSLYFNSLWRDAEIYAFEPVTATYEKLTRAVEGLGSKIHCAKLALSDKSGKACIHLSNNSVFATLNPLAVLPEALSGEKESVTTTTVTEWCTSRGLPGIDLLKVDAEGHDLCVLMGAAAMFERQTIGAVLVEIHLGPKGDPKLDSVRGWLEQYHYVLCGIYDQHCWSAKRLFFGNFLFLPARMISQ